MNKLIYLSLILFIGLSSCSNESTQEVSDSTDIAVERVVPEADSTQLFPSVAEVDEDTIVYDTLVFPREADYEERVLLTGVFHEGEVWLGADRVDWYGLFKDSAGYYMGKTKIKTWRVRDEIVDQNDNDKTGWEVATANKDTSIILINALPYLTEHKVQAVVFPKQSIYPGDTFSFTYLGVDYKLFAEGGKRKVQSDPEFYVVWNYKLYLNATINGRSTTELLVAEKNFDDAMIRILFGGDMDGDGLLDLIIDTSRHYNTFSPTIYFSKPAAKGHLLRVVGGHTSVGC